MLYAYFDKILEHALLGKVKLVFLRIGEFISTDTSLAAKEVLTTSLWLKKLFS